MGFYGNIADGAKSNLTFDKIYPNRKQMFDQAKDDHVFIGRFVLVEYDDNTYTIREGYYDLGRTPTATGNVLYLDSTQTVPFSDFSKSDIGYPLTASVNYGDLVKVIAEEYEMFFVCSSFGENGLAYFNYIPNNKSAIGNSQDFDYLVNYNIDKEAYQDIFVDGWDSTIWQKVIESGEVSYKPIGSLNSRVPRFHIVKEAPTDEPIAPHFDAAGTNLDYTLHMQSTWGARIKKAEDLELSNALIKKEYTEPDPTNEETGKLIIPEEDGYPGDIYYNAAGFDPKVRSDKSDPELYPNYIEITSGQTGEKYWDRTEQGEHIYDYADNVKEISVHLPIVGNMANEFYDLMYGDYLEEPDADGNIIKPERILDVQWGNQDGVRMVVADPVDGGYLYRPKQSATVAGCINSVHDLMGNIIVTIDDNDIYETAEDGSLVLDPTHGAPVIDTNKIIDKLEVADLNHVYYGKLDASGKNKFFLKTRKNTYYPVAEEDLIAFSGGRKSYHDLTQYEPGVYYIKQGDLINPNYYIELKDRPTKNVEHYLVNYTPITLTPWESATPPKDDGMNAISAAHFYKDTDISYLQDLNGTATFKREYFTLLLTPTTSGDSLDVTPPIRLFNPRMKKTCITNSTTDPDTGEIVQEENIYTGYLYFLKDSSGDYTGGVGELMIHKEDEEGNLLFDAKVNGNNMPVQEMRGETPVENADYFYVNQYILRKMVDDEGNIEYYPARLDGNPFGVNESGEIILPINSEDYQVTFLPFEQNKYYFKDIESEAARYVLLEYADDINFDKIYYTIEATVENGEVEKVPDDNPDAEPEKTETQYYIKNKYYYLKYNDFIFSTNDTMDPTALYCTIDPILLEDIEFYVDGKYYYDLETEDGTVKILDNSDTMKYPGEEIDGGVVLTNHSGLVYYTEPDLYVISDDSGTLDEGSKWDTPLYDIKDLPSGLKLGALYTGENIDEDGVALPDGEVLNPREKTARMYEWKELEGFADSYNTIHGLIVQLNQYFKFDDNLTRDPNTIQGCLNSIRDKVNDFGELVPGWLTITDKYGRLISAALNTEENGQDGWIEMDIDPNAINPSISIIHKDAKSTDKILGQKVDKVLEFGDTFSVPSFGIDDKGHVPEDTFVEHTVTIPALSVIDEGTKPIIADLAVSENGQSLELSRIGTNDLIISEYNNTNKTSTVENDQTINLALHKIVARIEEEEKTRASEISRVLDGVDPEKIDGLNEVIDYLDTNGGEILENFVDLTQSVDNNEEAIKILNGDTSTNGSVAKAINDLDEKLGNQISGLADGAVADNAAAITKLNADENTEGSIAYILKDYVLKSEYETKVTELTNMINALWPKFNITYSVEGDAPASCTPDIATLNMLEVPWESEQTVANNLETSEAVLGEQSGSWSFNGWVTSDATVEENSFKMPKKDVAFIGSWTFTPASTEEPEQPTE